jgi:hypothetical protein
VQRCGAPHSAVLRTARNLSICVVMMWQSFGVEDFFRWEGNDLVSIGLCRGGVLFREELCQFN